MAAGLARLVFTSRTASSADNGLAVTGTLAPAGFGRAIAASMNVGCL
jgi:hypothetical protein